MAFKRSSFKSLVREKKEFFATNYKLSKKIKWDFGSECYVLMLGLETGFYETAVHKIRAHKVDGQTIGYGNSGWDVYIKCKGVDEDGNKIPSLCCQLAKAENDRTDNSESKCLSFMSTRVHIPILILGNSLKEEKSSYPIHKVSILNTLNSEKGLNFAYLDMAASSFEKDVVQAYGKKLKEDGILDYELDESSEEYLDDIRKRLINTVVKIKAVRKAGFNKPLKEYSFFPFNNPAIASQSPEGEREAIVNYKKNKEIMAKVDEFLTLFSIEVDNICREWTEKDLQEYYNSFIGKALKEETTETNTTNEKVEVIGEEEIPFDNTVAGEATLDTALLDGDLEEPVKEEPKKVETVVKETPKPVETPKTKEVEIEDIEFDTEDEDEFFAD